MSELNLRPEDLDRLGKALVTLTKELSVAKDRIRVLEATLVNAGVIEAGAVEVLQPDAQLTAELEAERAQLIDHVLSALASHD